MPTILIANATQLLTLAGGSSPRRRLDMKEIGVIANGAVLLTDGVITAVGQTHDLETLPEAKTATVIDAAGKVVMPAYVDSHTHLVFAEPRLTDFEMRIAGAKTEEIGRSGGGIASSVRTTRKASKGDLTARAIHFAQKALETGTATIEVKSGYGLDAETEIRILETIRGASAMTAVEMVPTFLGAHVVPSDTPRAKYVKLVAKELIPRVARGRLAEFCDVFCDRGAFTLEETRAIFREAVRHNL